MNTLPLLLQCKILSSFTDTAYDLEDLSLLQDPGVQAFCRFFGHEPEKLNNLYDALYEYSIYPLPLDNTERSRINKLFEALKVHGIEALDEFTKQISRVSFKDTFERCSRIPILDIADDDPNPYSIYTKTTYQNNDNPERSIVMETGDIYAGSIIEDVVEKLPDVVKLLDARHRNTTIKSGHLALVEIALRKGGNTVLAFNLFNKLTSDKGKDFKLDWGSTVIGKITTHESQKILKCLGSNERQQISKKIISSDFEL